jgi:hypothetical protein
MKFLSGFSIAILALSSWTWALPVGVVIALATFWRELSHTAGEAWTWFEMLRLHRDAAATLHLDCPADLAWRYFVGERE